MNNYLNSYEYLICSKLAKFFIACETRIDYSEILVWVPFCKIKELTDILEEDTFSGENMKVTLQYDSIVLNAYDIIELFDIKKELFEGVFMAEYVMRNRP